MRRLEPRRAAAELGTTAPRAAIAVGSPFRRRRAPRLEA